MRLHHEQAVGSLQHPCHPDLCRHHQREEAEGRRLHSVDRITGKRLPAGSLSIQIGRFSMKKFKFRPVSRLSRAVFDKKVQIPPDFDSFIH